MHLALADRASAHAEAVTEHNLAALEVHGMVGAADVEEARPVDTERVKVLIPGPALDHVYCSLVGKKVAVSEIHHVNHVEHHVPKHGNQRKLQDVEGIRLHLVH